MSKQPASKVKNAIMSFAVSPDIAALIRQIPQHTKWIGDVISRELGVCPTCRQKVEYGKKETP